MNLKNSRLLHIYLNAIKTQHFKIHIFFHMDHKTIISYQFLLYTYNWYHFRTVCFPAILYRKPDQRTEVFWIHITIL